MKENSRTENSAKNIMVSIVNQVITLVLSFVMRTVFIYTLGETFLGYNGLFTNIITMLSLAELGIGIALPASLYKPLAENDKPKIRALMNFYSKVYNLIGIVVFVVGISLTPLLPYIDKNFNNVANLNLIYFLFVLNSAVTYFFTYKRSMIIADQKAYVVTKISYYFTTALTIVQIISLFLLRNYIVYLGISILFTIAQNLYISKKCSKLYPFIQDKTDEKVSKSDLKTIKKNVSALFLYKLGIVITNGTDNIIITKFLGVITVGLYSNYLLIIKSVSVLLFQIYDSVAASVGNLIAGKEEKRKYDLYNVVTFFNFIMYSICGNCILLLVNPFIKVWVGEKFLLDYMIVVVLVLNFYVAGMQNANTAFRNAYGLFWQGKYRPVVMVIINLVASIILIQYIGLVGVFIGTLLSRLLTTAWFDPYIVHKHGFKRSIKPYLLKYSLYFVVAILNAIVVGFITKFIPTSNFGYLIIKAIAVFALSSFILLILFYRTSEYKYLKNAFSNLSIVKKISKR